MKTREKIIVLIIIGYVLSVIFYLALGYSITFENNKDKPMQMVELFTNDTARNYEIEQLPQIAPSFLYGILAAVLKLAFALPFTIAGFGLVSTPMMFLQTHLFETPEGLRVLIFWIISIITIPINFIFTKDIIWYCRVSYIYILAAIISGTPMLLSENFGQ